MHECAFPEVFHGFSLHSPGPLETILNAPATGRSRGFSRHRPRLRLKPRESPECCIRGDYMSNIDYLACRDN